MTAYLFAARIRCAFSTLRRLDSFALPVNTARSVPVPRPTVAQHLHVDDLHRATLRVKLASILAMQHPRSLC